MSVLEVRVPDIGDFDGVAVIEVLVKVGDTVKAEQSLITAITPRSSAARSAGFGGPALTPSS